MTDQVNNLILNKIKTALKSSKITSKKIDDRYSGVSKSSDKSFESIADNSPDVISRFDKNLKYVYLNKASEKFTGLESSNYIGKDHSELNFPENMVVLWHDGLQKVFKTGQNVEIEYTSPTAIGLRCFQANLFPEFDIDGSVKTVISLNRDISVLKETEQVLKNYTGDLSRVMQRYNALIHASDQIIFSWDANTDTNIIFEGSVEKVLGYKSNDLIGERTKWTKLIHPDDITSFEAANSENIAISVESIKLEFRIKRNDGEYIFVEENSYFNYDNNGVLAGSIGFVIDVTERRKLNEEIKFHAGLLNMVEQAIISTDLSGNILFWNDYAELLLGWKREEVLGENAAKIYIKSVQEELISHIGKISNSGESWSGELNLTKKDGTIFPVKLTLSPVFDSNQKVIGRISVSSDITIEKKLQNNLAEYDRKFRLISQNMHELLFAFDMERNLIFINSENAMAYLFECTVNEMQTMDFPNYIHPDDRWRIESMVESTYKGDTNSQIEARIILCSGKVQWHGFSSSPILDETGNQVGIEVLEWGINKLKTAEFALKESEERYRGLVELSPDAILLTDIEGVIVFANQKSAKLFKNLKVTELLGKSIKEMVNLEFKDLEVELKKNSLDKGYSQVTEYKFITNEGGEFYGDLSSSLVHDKDGYPTGFVMIVRDLSERKTAQNILIETNQKLEALIEASPLGVVTVDNDKNITLWNKASERMFGWTEEEVLGRKLPLAQNEIEEPSGFMSNVIEGELSLNLETKRVRKDMSVIDISMSLAPLKSADNKIYGSVAVLADITEHKKYEKQIHDLAFYDQLTGLPNRVSFQERLVQEIENSKKNSSKLAVIFVDLDRFKMINDLLGHSAGDILLKEVARRFSTTIRSTDIVSRQGGDEFTLILTDLENDELATVTANKLLEVLSDPIEIDKQEVFINPSIGISIYPDNAKDLDCLVKFADVAMYFAKKKGGNIYQFYTTDMNSRVVDRIMIESKLRGAIKRDELLIYYQPKIDLHTGSIISAECLVRWNSHELGLVSPLRFIPIAEETGLISLIDEWVFKTACKQNKEWQKNGFPEQCIAVNIATKEIDKKLVSTIESALRNSGLESKYLEIEITESGIMEVDESVVSILEEIRALGVRIAVDDFGTGYSSLSRLKDLPIDSLKIDQSFIRNLSNDSRDSAIVSSIITIGHNLGLKVIAEGVENEKTAQFLRNQNCDEFQGYFLSPPLPHDQFLSFLNKQKKQEEIVYIDREKVLL